jgi:exodeoxyribonuclease VII small subunit
VVERLDSVVKRLEGGELSLEDSLREFEEGIRLVRRGEKLLTDAERRIEQLLSDGGEDRAIPLQVAPPGAGNGAHGGIATGQGRGRNGDTPRAPAGNPSPPTPASKKGPLPTKPPDDDDVPF